MYITPTSYSDLNTALQNMQPGDLTIEMAPGQYPVVSPIYNLPAGFRFIGSGITSTQLIKRFIANPAVITLQSPGCYMQDLSIQCDNLHTGGMAIELVAASSISPDYSVLRNIYITGAAAAWTAALHINGAARTNAIGVRDVLIDNVLTFSCSQSNVHINTATNLMANQLQCFSANGGVGSLIINNSHECTINSTFIEKVAQHTNNKKCILTCPFIGWINGAL